MSITANIKYVFIVSTLLTIPFYIYGQDYAKDMEEIHNTYAGKGLSFKMTYTFYPYSSSTTGADSMRGSCSMEGNKYYYTLNTAGSRFEYVNTGKYFFIVDHLQKAIALRSSATAKAPKWSVQNLDSIIKVDSVKITYKNLIENKAEYTINLTKRKWNKVKIIFSKKDFTLSKIYMYATGKGKIAGQKYDNPYIVINYSDYSRQVNKQLFNTQRYFASTAKDNVTPAAAYKKYKVLDYIHVEK